jgi:hypothetical protein
VWNGVFKKWWYESNTVFNVAMNVTTNAIFSINTSTTVLVDATASWDVNEYVGQLLQVQSAGTVGSAVTNCF